MFKGFSGHRCSAADLVLFLLVGALFDGNAAFGQNRPGERYLRGWTTPDSIYHYIPNLRADEAQYAPDAEAVTELRKAGASTEVLVFFGNWCSDSKRELPRFFATLNRLDSTLYHARYFGLDRTKQDSTGVATEFEIDLVPTFIFRRNGKDLGRIVEQPEDPLELEWVALVNHDPLFPQRQRLVRLLRDAILGMGLRNTNIL